MCFDECPALPATEAEVAKSMRLSMRWAQRSRDAFGDRPGHALFGIMQGGVTRELREESAEALKAIGFDGYAVGGLAVGEGQEAMFGVLDYAPGHAAAGQAALPDGGRQARRHRGRGGARHRHDGLRAAVALGPHRAGLDAARAGQPAQRPSQDDPRPLDEACTCPACRSYSRAYLHHVFRSQEIIASMLLTWHNLHYFQELMQGLRDAIADGRLAAFVAEFHALRAEGDIEPV